MRTIDYITIKEASENWGVGTRIITVYCVEGRIEGAVKKGHLWLIPKNALKPPNKRRKKVVVHNNKEPAVCKNIYDLGYGTPCAFQSLYENKELFAEIIKHFPYPMHICATDGTMLLANEAYLKFAKISNPEKLYKKHNILSNPNLERWGIKDFVVRAFRGEAVRAYDVKVPHQEIVERLGDNKEPVFGSLYHDMTAFPIHGSDGQLLYIVFIFIISREYQGKEEIIKGKEYIDSHWNEDFDIDKLAEAVYISKYRYVRLFKQHTGMTPYCYYQEVKIEKIKGKLCESNLSIAQAFAECGVDYNGNFVKVFKQKTGMSPSEYRTMMTKK
jgi:AraC-like DNA-binding protein